MSELRQCRICKKWLDSSWAMYDGVCVACLNERERQKEIEQQRREDEERRHREMMELEERHHQEMLDATLPWNPCSHCGTKTRQDKIKEVDGKKLCGDCADKIRKCDYCGCKYVMSGRKVIYKKVEDFVKKGSEIYHNYANWVHPQNEKEKRSYEQYDGIRRTLEYMCPSCYEKSKNNQKEMWETSHKLKTEYEKLKAAKERADREEEERKEREAERRRQEKEREEAEEEARKEAAEKKSKANMSAGCLGFIMLVTILIAFYAKGGNMGAALVLGVGAFVLSMVLRSVTSHLFVGLIFALCFEMVFGLIISIVCYFVWHAFVAPLVICFFAFLLLFTILSATGVIDKTPEGKTPFDSIGDFLDKFH
ncbi:hypothetical protein [Fibrobacter sp.]|uniref:hypothetical protein n=1 Tax=Fibrobacter sp. TaxID=35828 RepID=UPI00388E415D